MNAPLFAVFLLGMFWQRATGHGAFLGLLAGTAAATIHHGLTLPHGSGPGIKGGWLAGASFFFRRRRNKAPSPSREQTSEP